MNKIKIQFLFFFFIGLIQSLQSQQACHFLAKVTDAQSNDPIEGAILKMDDLDTYLRTDSLGRIRMDVKCGEHVINLSFPGYKPFYLRYTIESTRPTAKPKPLLVQMESIINQLEEVVVTSQSNVRNLETPALGVSIMNLKAVQKLPPAAGEVDVLRSLQNLPGVSSVGEGANGINIRGGSVDQNLILLDHMPIYNPTHLLGLFSLFPTDAIRELQLYKGSIPARYGGRAAGVLDVRLAEPSMEKFTLKGGIGLISNRLQAEVPIIKDKMAWLSSARVSFNEYLIKFYNNALLKSIGDRRLPDNRPVFFDLVNKLNWRLTSKDNLSIVSYISHDSYRIDSLFSIAGIVPKQAEMNYGHNNVSVRWNHFFSTRFNFNLLGVQSIYQTKTSSSELKTGFDFNTKLIYQNVKGEITYAPNKLNRINMGLSLTRIKLNPGDLVSLEGSSISPISLTQESGLEAALFFSDEYELSNKLLIELGLRAVRFWNLGPTEVNLFEEGSPKVVSSITEVLNIKGIESAFNRFEPRLALRYKLNDLTSVKIGYNRMNQFLHMISNNSTPLPNVRWKTSNRYIPPEQSDLISIGLFKDTRNHKWEGSLEMYNRWQRSIFDYLNGAELSVNRVVETQILPGKGKAYGIELMINKKKGIMTGWMSYTYARSFEKILGEYPSIQQLNDGKWFPTIIDKPHTLNTLVNFQTEKHNAVSLTFTYSTGRPYTAPVSFYKNGLKYFPVYTDRNNGRISDYHRLDFSWIITNPSMKAKRWEGSWIVTIYNLYGRKNAFSYFFNPDASAFKPFKVSVFPSPIFSLTYNFKFE
jgi:TonB-dependent Receptor Plug Domain